MNLYAWAARHGVGHVALRELQLELGLDYDDTPTYSDAQTESGVMVRTRINHNKSGGRCWRNNSGVLEDANGRPVRFGLANDSPAVNQIIKSSDLIGIKPTIVTNAMVGQLIGQFWARECKAPGWRYTGTEREVAQLAFINLVVRLGGDAAFVS